jgi:Cu(I)/Ag(I) efflux system membrane fusion protein
MYGQVEIDPRADAAPVFAVPDSAVIDGGATQTVLIEQGEGRYQPRPVKLGRHGDGYVEVMLGVKPGEEVVSPRCSLSARGYGRCATPSSMRSPISPIRR